jgi:2-dehydro-3-deoxyphosphogluconate aldolase/(4S)-4-hydroxy-2-oxoglutarate aldolase
MSDVRERIREAIEREGVVAVVRIQAAKDLRRIAEALVEGGVRVVEVTMTVPGGLDLIAALAPTMPREVVLGAGTVMDKDTAARAIDAGARYIVTPAYRPALIGVCHSRGVPIMPGCLSPTEIVDAWERGADIVKVFPASVLGPGYIADLLGPFPRLRLMPTGGVTIANAGDWIRAGAVALGVGSALLDREAIAAGDYGVIRRNAERVVANVRLARGIAR